MNKNYDENTRYQAADDEATQFEDSSTAGQHNQTITSNDEVEVKDVKKSLWKRSAAGAGSGLLIGGVATILMGMKSADPNLTDTLQEGNNHRDELTNPEWVDDQIQVATCVNDDMTFGEAFAAARAEVGPGGCFEWHGNVYGTYTADEWNHMTAEQRAEWSDHFSWNHIDHSSSDVANSSHTLATNDDDIEVVSVDHESTESNISHQQTNISASINGQSETTLDSETEPDIEIIGVMHDEETGMNMGGMIVDGQEVILIDVDGDMVFDYRASDLNGNGKLEPAEFEDIESQGITVNHLGGFSIPYDDSLLSDDASDYSTDMYEA